jgi:hypothetical protein
VATFSLAELADMGYTVVDGRAVRASTLGTPEDRKDRVKLPGRFKSKWEADYAQKLGTLCLQGGIQWWGYESIRLRLATGAWYTPDFIVRINGRIEAREVKGFWREAARVRVKVAAEQFPWLPIYIVRYTNGQFRTIEVFNG